MWTKNGSGGNSSIIIHDPWGRYEWERERPEPEIGRTFVAKVRPSLSLCGKKKFSYSLCVSLCKFEIRLGTNLASSLIWMELSLCSHLIARPANASWNSFPLSSANFCGLISISHFGSKAFVMSEQNVKVYSSLVSYFHEPIYVEKDRDCNVR